MRVVESWTGPGLHPAHVVQAIGRAGKRAVRTEEGTELAFDEVGQPDSVGARGGRGEEGFQVLLDHAVQDRVGGGARDVGSHGAGSSGFRAVPTARPQDVRTTDARRSRCRGATTSQPSVARTRHRNRSS
jgi:hypothetical protein